MKQIFDGVSEDELKTSAVATEYDKNIPNESLVSTI